MIYGLYWKTTGKRYNSNTTPLLFATKKGANSYIKNQKSCGLNKALVSKVFTGSTMYTLIEKKTGFILPSTLEKDIAEGAKQPYEHIGECGIEISRPKEIFALVTIPCTRIMCVFKDRESALKAQEILQAVEVDYKVIKIK